MQGAMWFGTQSDPHRMPKKGELQLTDIFSNYHLHMDGKKMSKSTGNFYTGDQFIEEMGYDSDQVRYFLSLLSLPEKNSNFDFETFQKRNHFLAGPLNAVLKNQFRRSTRNSKEWFLQENLLEKQKKKLTKLYRTT